MKNILTNIIIGVVILILMFWVISGFFNTLELEECTGWKKYEDKQEEPFYSWQIEQCKYHGIELRIIK